MVDYPVYDVDMYSEEVLLDPFPHYAKLRELGPVVWLPKHDLWVVARYQEVKAALLNPEIFLSGKGVAANDPANQASKGTTLCSDGELHDRLRRFIMNPLLPKSLKEYTELFEAEAAGLVDGLIGKKNFDAIADCARHLPLTVVRELVGLSEDGQDNMLEWGAAAFNIQGVMNERAAAQMEEIQKIGAHSAACCADPEGKLKSGGWGRRVYDGGQNGDIPVELTPSVLLDYIIPSLDTTILGTGAVLMLLAQNPEQWDILRAEPKFIPNAIAEALRVESPARGFTRYVARDYELEGVSFNEGDRVWTVLPSANRDERHWDNPEVFDVKRKNAGQHVAFGVGSHICAGMHLAKLEIKILLEAFVKKGIKRIELNGAPVYRPNNTLYGLKNLPVTLHT